MIVETDELVDRTMIAKEAGVTPNAVSNWATRYPDFPIPVWENHTPGVWSVRLWQRWQINAWRQYHGK